MPTYKRGDETVHTVPGTAADRALAADSNWHEGNRPAPAPPDTTDQQARPTRRSVRQPEPKPEAEADTKDEAS